MSVCVVFEPHLRAKRVALGVGRAIGLGAGRTMCSTPSTTPATIPTLARSESAASAGRPMSRQCIRGPGRRQRGVRADWRIARAWPSSAAARARSATTARSSACTDTAWDLAPSSRRMSATVAGSSESRSSSDSAVGGGPVSGVGGAPPADVVSALDPVLALAGQLPGSGDRRVCGLPPVGNAEGAAACPALSAAGMLTTRRFDPSRGAKGSRSRSAARRRRSCRSLTSTHAVVEGVRLESHAARAIIQNICLGLQIARAVGWRGDRQRPRLGRRRAQPEPRFDVDQAARKRLGVRQAHTHSLGCDVSASVGFTGVPKIAPAEVLRRSAGVASLTVVGSEGCAHPLAEAAK